MYAYISLLADHFAKVRQTLPNDPLALSAEMIVLQEGLDLLIAYRSIPDRTTRLLLKALVEELSPKDRMEHTLEVANINVLNTHEPDAS